MTIMSILDQSPITCGSDARTALNQTVRLAQIADSLSFKRYWVAEHHHTDVTASSAPEVLASTLAAHTQRIRVGSGGVMLPHYSAYKVAECFRVLEALYPGRIDLGFGASPGGFRLSTDALRDGRELPAYSEQVADLQSYMSGPLPASHRFRGLFASPVIQTAPELWVLGASSHSAQLAAFQGISFAYGFAMVNSPDPEPLSVYRQSFKPSYLQGEPHCAMLIHAVCADTDRKAQEIAQAVLLSIVWGVRKKRFFGIPTVSVAREYQYDQVEVELAKTFRNTLVVGEPSTVKQQIEELRDRYQVDEFLCLSNIADFEQRVRSYELIDLTFRIPNQRTTSSSK